MTPRMFDDFPSTVLLDVIEYLSPIDRYRALHNLNSRLNGILRHSTTHIDMSQIGSRDDFDYYLKHILPDVIIRLRSLKISNDFIFDKIQTSTHDSDTPIMFGIIKKVHAKVNLVKYEKLEELILENITAAQLQLISEKLVHMSHMKHLIISFHGTTSDACKAVFNNDVIRPILTRLKLKLTNADAFFPQMTTIQNLSKLEHLTVRSCRIQNIATLLSLVQNITYLDISIWDFPDQQQTYLAQKFQLPNLRYLILKVDEIKWSFVEHFLKQCGEKLKYLTFTGDNDYNFINPKKWETLIVGHLKHLVQFNFLITLWESSIDNVDLILFNTDFWHQLNVYVACDLIKSFFEGGGDIVRVYTVPFCNSLTITAASAVSVIAPSTNAPYKNIQTLKVILDKKPFRDTKHFYENVNSILLESSIGHHSDILLLLRTSVNLKNICHLGFESVRAILKAQVFNQLLEQCPNIYSLNLHSTTLIEMTNIFSNERICLLLQKMVKQIQFKAGLEQEDFDYQTMRKFAQTFTNLERLHIHMRSSEDIMTNLPVMIDNMKVLNKIFIKTPKNIPNGFIDQIKDSIFDLKESYIRREKCYLFIWR